MTDLVLWMRTAFEDALPDSDAKFVPWILLMTTAYTAAYLINRRFREKRKDRYTSNDSRAKSPRHRVVFTVIVGGLTFSFTVILLGGTVKPVILTEILTSPSGQAALLLYAGGMLIFPVLGALFGFSSIFVSIDRKEASGSSPQEAGRPVLQVGEEGDGTQSSVDDGARADGRWQTAKNCTEVVVRVLAAISLILGIIIGMPKAMDVLSLPYGEETAAPRSPPNPPPQPASDGSEGEKRFRN